MERTENHSDKQITGQPRPEKGPFRVLILTHGGCEGLIDSLSGTKDIEIGGVIVETNTDPLRPLSEKFSRSLKYDGLSGTIKKFFRFNRVGKDAEGKGPSAHAKVEEAAVRNTLPFYTVRDFHDSESLELIASINADLGVIWGTNIVRRSVFGIPRLGSINLHQGHAPYYRGGPTVFWELMNGESRVGITVHYVAERVDTGDIVAQDFVPLEYDWNLFGTNFEPFLNETRQKLLAPSVELMTKAIIEIAAGKAQRTEQDISIGKRYRIPTFREREMLKKQLRLRFSR